MTAEDILSKLLTWVLGRVHSLLQKLTQVLSQEVRMVQMVAMAIVKRKAGADTEITDADDVTLTKKSKLELSGPGSSSSSKVAGEEIVSAVSAEGDVETDEDRIVREEEEIKRAIYLKRLAGKYVLPTMPVKEVLIGRPLSTMKGHTAFLTFAVRPPLAAVDAPK